MRVNRSSFRPETGFGRLRGTLEPSGTRGVGEPSRGNLLGNELARSFGLLPPEQRLRHYRRMAELMFKLAMDAPSDTMKAAYLNLATGWHDLAIGLELELERPVLIARSDAAKANP